MFVNIYKHWLKPIYIDVRDFALDTLFPIRCIICEAEGAFACPNCRQSLERVPEQQCIVCRKPSPFGLTHAGCRTPHGADGSVSIYDYHDRHVADILIQGKYKFLPGVYGEIGEAAAEVIDASHTHLLEAAEPFSLVPIPLAPSRERWRGFNQSELLCQALSTRLGLLTLHTLERTRATRTQKELGREQRQQNMAGAFRLRKGMDIHGRNLLLVDDVITTGSTLLEAAKVLKRNGAAKVWCLAIARD